MNSINKKQRGFTLIELISVVAIILILALIALPSLSGYREKADRSKAVASAKILLNAAETFNAQDGGDSYYRKNEQTNEVEKTNSTGVIGDNYAVQHILLPAHNYIDSYMGENEQKKLRNLVEKYGSNFEQQIYENEITIKDLKDFVENEGKKVDNCKVYFEKGKIVKK